MNNLLEMFTAIGIVTPIVVLLAVMYHVAHWFGTRASISDVNSVDDRVSELRRRHLALSGTVSELRTSQEWAAVVDMQEQQIRELGQTVAEQGEHIDSLDEDLLTITERLNGNG